MKIGERPNGKDIAETRITVETYYEYYLEFPEEIKAIVNMLAINADSFDFEQYMKKADEPAEKDSSIITV